MREVRERELKIIEGLRTLWMISRFSEICYDVDDPFVELTKEDIQKRIISLAKEHPFKIKINEQLVIYMMKREFESIRLEEYLVLKKRLMMKKIKALPKETHDDDEKLKVKPYAEPGIWKKYELKEEEIMNWTKFFHDQNRTKIFHGQNKEKIFSDHGLFKQDLWNHINDSAMGLQIRDRMLKEVYLEEKLMYNRIKNIHRMAIAMGNKAFDQECMIMMEASLNTFKTKCSQWMHAHNKILPGDAECSRDMWDPNARFYKNIWDRMGKLSQELDNQKANSALGPQRFEMFDQMLTIRKKIMKMHLRARRIAIDDKEEWDMMTRIEIVFNTFKTKCRRFMNDKLKVQPFTDSETTSAPKFIRAKEYLELKNSKTNIIVESPVEENELTDKEEKEEISDRIKFIHDQMFMRSDECLRGLHARINNLSDELHMNAFHANFAIDLQKRGKVLEQFYDERKFTSVGVLNHESEGVRFVRSFKTKGCRLMSKLKISFAEHLHYQNKEEIFTDYAEFFRDLWICVNKLRTQVDMLDHQAAMDSHTRYYWTEISTRIHKSKVLMIKAIKKEHQRAVSIEKMKEVIDRESFAKDIQGCRFRMEKWFYTFKAEVNWLRNAFRPSAEPGTKKGKVAKASKEPFGSEKEILKVQPYAEAGTKEGKVVNKLYLKVLDEPFGSEIRETKEEVFRYEREVIPGFCYPYLKMTSMTGYPESIFKDKCNVIPDLWYRFLKMMLEQEFRICQAYSAMDPQKREEKLEEFKKLGIEGQKFVDTHFKKMQKMKMHPRAVKEIQKWWNEMEEGLRTFNNKLKKPPFAELVTTFVPKVPDEEEKRKKMKMKHKVPRTEKASFEEQVKKCLMKKCFKPKVDEKILKEKLLKLEQKEKLLMKKAFKIGNAPGPSWDDEKQRIDKKEKLLKKAFKIGNAPGPSWDDEKQRTDKKEELLRKAFKIGNAPGPSWDDEKQRIDKKEELLKKMFKIATKSCLIRKALTIKNRVPDEDLLTLSDFENFEFDEAKLSPPVITLESAADYYYSDMTEEQLITSFGKGSHLRFEVWKVVPRRNIDPTVYNVSGYDELLLFGVITAQNVIPDPRYSEACHDSECFYLFNRTVDYPLPTSHFIPLRELLHCSLEIYGSLKLRCVVGALAIDEFDERLLFKESIVYEHHLDVKPKRKLPYPKMKEFYFDNDLLHLCDDEKEINFSEFFAWKPRGGFSSTLLKGKRGYLEFHYAALRFAVDATIEVEVFASRKETQFVGRVMAYYGKDFDHGCPQTVIFEATGDGFIFPGKLNLMRSVLAVPSEFSVIIQAELCDFTSQKLLVSGAYEFRVPVNEPSSVGCIQGCDGCLLQLKVHWNLPCC